MNLYKKIRLEIHKEKKHLEQNNKKKLFDRKKDRTINYNWYRIQFNHIFYNAFVVLIQFFVVKFLREPSFNRDIKRVVNSELFFCAYLFISSIFFNTKIVRCWSTHTERVNDLK